MKTKINDNFIIILTIVIIALFVSINIYMEKDDKWNENVSWFEINIPPDEEIKPGLFNYKIETATGEEIIAYDLPSGDMSGNYTKIGDTLFFSEMSLTIIEISGEHLKALLVPTEITPGKYCLFTVQTSLQGDYECNITCNDEIIAWDEVYSSNDLLIFGVSFDQRGSNSINVDIETENENYKLEWTVNVRG